jgi:hypothetical protein
MKRPPKVEKLTLYMDFVACHPYPPLGFVPFEQNQLGNGDYFGLYWPIGRENEEPLVVEMQHDGWSMCPAFSSLDAFLALANNSLEWVGPPTLEQDPRSPFANYSAAREALARDAVDEAHELLQRAISILPEFGEAQWTLSRQLLRVGRDDDAFEASLLALIAPPCWGGASNQALSWLKRRRSCPSRYVSDPLWLRRHSLTFKFGGSKENRDYDFLRQIIDGYVEQGDSIKATLLLQTYGELMSRETTSFQERYAFDVAKHIAEQIQTAHTFGIERDPRLLEGGTL